MGKALDHVSALKSKAQAQVDEFDSLSTEMTDDMKAERDAGFDEGVAQNTTPGAKIYTEEDLQAELSPWKDRASKAEADVASLKEQLAAAQGSGSVDGGVVTPGKPVEGGIVLQEGQVVVQQADLDKLNGQVKALGEEAKGLRSAIQAEIDDQAQDTKRLEAAIAPIEPAPVPDIPAPVEPTPLPAPGEVVDEGGADAPAGDDEIPPPQE